MNNRYTKNVNNSGKSKKSSNELLSSISVNTKAISDSINGKSSIWKILLSVVCTLVWFTFVYFLTLLLPEQNLNLDTFVSFINNSLFLVLLPFVYLFWFYILNGKISFKSWGEKK